MNAAYIWNFVRGFFHFSGGVCSAVVLSYLSLSPMVIFIFPESPLPLMEKGDRPPPFDDI